MIKINLLGEDAQLNSNQSFWLLAWGLSLVILGLVFGFIGNRVAAEVDRLTVETTTLQKELAELQEITKEVRHLESLEEELNSKLAVISTLKRNKSGPVRVLDDLNEALPERAWLTEIAEDRGSLVLLGFALDDHTVSTFMKDLESSAYFEKIDLDHSKLVEVEGARIREFRINANINYAAPSGNRGAASEI